ncbi:hypothetical protein LUW76_47190 [Actinomadura madurae]|uniref:hypothetical protein n=1 Tax=Actinomadura madurae TaxID=1993 RepID=UPI002026B469|nr:hypothetical protein [Actinomadura madurae]URN01283.1 hypothetical protein LUW76_47190 [Actinomadura madurae]
MPPRDPLDEVVHLLVRLRDDHEPLAGLGQVRGGPHHQRRLARARRGVDHHAAVPAAEIGQDRVDDPGGRLPGSERRRVRIVRRHRRQAAARVFGHDHSSSASSSVGT